MNQKDRCSLLRKMLLSMKPFWFDKVMSGEKIYEYRNRFPNEEIEAYVYVSNPVKAIAGILYLAPRIELTEWLSMYSDEEQTKSKIEEYLKKNKYAMPIKATQKIKYISLEEMKSSVEKFIIPESYYYLENYKAIAETIERKVKYDGDQRVTEIKRFQDKNEICRKYERGEIK